MASYSQQARWRRSARSSAFQQSRGLRSIARTPHNSGGLPGGWLRSLAMESRAQPASALPMARQPSKDFRSIDLTPRVETRSYDANSATRAAASAASSSTSRSGRLSAGIVIGRGDRLSTSICAPMRFSTLLYFPLNVISITSISQKALGTAPVARSVRGSIAGAPVTRIVLPRSVML